MIVMYRVSVSISTTKAFCIGKLISITPISGPKPWNNDLNSGNH